MYMKLQKLSQITLIFTPKVTLEHWKGRTKSSYTEGLTYQGRLCPSPDRLWLSTLEAMCPLKNAACSWLPEHPWRLLCRSLLRGPWKIQITHLEIYGMIRLENVFEGTRMNILFSWLHNLVPNHRPNSVYSPCLCPPSISSPMNTHKSASQCQSLTTAWRIGKKKHKKTVFFHVGSAMYNL